MNERTDKRETAEPSAVTASDGDSPQFQLEIIREKYRWEGQNIAAEKAKFTLIVFIISVFLILIGFVGVFWSHGDLEKGVSVAKEIILLILPIFTLVLGIDKGKDG